MTELKKALDMKTDTERMKNTSTACIPPGNSWEWPELETYSRILHDDTSDDLTISTYTETVIGRMPAGRRCEEAWKSENLT